MNPTKPSQFEYRIHPMTDNAAATGRAQLCASSYNEVAVVMKFYILAARQRSSGRA